MNSLVRCFWDWVLKHYYKHTRHIDFETSSSPRETWRLAHRFKCLFLALVAYLCKPTVFTTRFANDCLRDEYRDPVSTDLSTVEKPARQYFVNKFSGK